MRNFINLIESHDITDVIEDEFTKTGYSDPQEVNDGYCYWFADRVVARLGQSPVTFAADAGDQELERVGQTLDPTAPRHCFIVHDGRVYDSEAPEGVDRWQDLPYFKRRSW